MGTLFTEFLHTDHTLHVSFNIQFPNVKFWGDLLFTFDCIQHALEFLGGSQVKDPALSLLWRWV